MSGRIEALLAAHRATIRSMKHHGKRVGRDAYFHRNLIDYVGGELREVVRAYSAVAGLPEDRFNVFKCSVESPRASLLLYEDFEMEPFPALIEATTIRVFNGTLSVRKTRSGKNPPILHRKELLLSPDHPRRIEFERLTNALESAGAFADTRRIGRKIGWANVLWNLGISINEQKVAAGR